MQYFTFPPSPPTYLMAVNRKGDIFGELNYGSSSISDLVWNKNLSKNENWKRLYSLFKDSFQSQVWNILRGAFQKNPGIFNENVQIGFTPLPPEAIMTT